MLLAFLLILDGNLQKPGLVPGCSASGLPAGAEPRCLLVPLEFVAIRDPQLGLQAAGPYKTEQKRRAFSMEAVQARIVLDISGGAQLRREA